MFAVEMLPHDKISFITELTDDNKLMHDVIRIGFSKGMQINDIIEEALALWVEHHSVELTYKYIDKY